MKIIAALFAGLACSWMVLTSPADALTLPVNLSIQIGIPPIVVGTPPVELSAPPTMVWEPGLGAYVALGSPYPVVYIGGVYYYLYGSTWYRGPSYAGPWHPMPANRLPIVLRRFPVSRWPEIQRQLGRPQERGQPLRYFRAPEYRAWKR